MNIKFKKIFKLSIILPFAALTIATPIVLTSCSLLGTNTPPLQNTNLMDLHNLKTFEDTTKVKDDTFTYMMNEYVQEITSSNTSLAGKKIVHNNFFSSLTSQTGQIFKFLQIGLNDTSFIVKNVDKFWSKVDETNKQLKVNVTLTKDGTDYEKEITLSPWIINGAELNSLKINIENIKDTHIDIYDSFIGDGDKSIFSFIDKINDKNNQFGGIVGYEMLILDKKNKMKGPKKCSIPLLVDGKYKFVKVTNKE